MALSRKNQTITTASDTDAQDRVIMRVGDVEGRVDKEEAFLARRRVERATHLKERGQLAEGFFRWHVRVSERHVQRYRAEQARAVAKASNPPEPNRFTEILERPPAPAPRIRDEPREDYRPRVALELATLDARLERLMSSERTTSRTSQMSDEGEVSPHRAPAPAPSRQATRSPGSPQPRSGRRGSTLASAMQRTETSKDWADSRYGRNQSGQTFRRIDSSEVVRARASNALRQAPPYGTRAPRRGERSLSLSPSARLAPRVSTTLDSF
jgi:hypothetical protein